MVEQVRSTVVQWGPHSRCCDFMPTILLRRRIAMLGSMQVKSLPPGRFLLQLVCATIFSLWLVMAAPSLAQNNAGSVPFSTEVRDQYDTIDLSNLNILVNVPVRQKTGAIPFNYRVAGNFQVYKNCPTCQFPSWGVQAGVSPSTDTDFFPALFTQHFAGAAPCPTSDTNWTYRDHLGATHLFCVPSPSLAAAAYDQSGYTIDVSGNSPVVYNLLGYQITGGKGTGTTGNSLIGSGLTSLKY